MSTTEPAPGAVKARCPACGGHGYHSLGKCRRCQGYGSLCSYCRVGLHGAQHCGAKERAMSRTTKRAATRCSHCYGLGHNRRGCIERKRWESLTEAEQAAERRAAVDALDGTRTNTATLVAAFDTARKGTSRCLRCQQLGHSAVRCTSPYPLEHGPDGELRVPESLTLAILTSRHADPTADLRSWWAYSFGVLVYGDGTARTYVAGQLDPRLGSVPVAESGAEVRRHFDQAERAKQRTAPVAVPVPLFRRLMPRMRVAEILMEIEDNRVGGAQLAGGE